MAVTQAQVAQLYVALFNRAAEGEGLRNWMADGVNKTMAQVADTMLQAPAVKTYFNGAIDNDRDFVEMIYKNILGKDYTQDPNGIDSWVLHLQLGHTRGETLVKLFEVAQSDIARAADPVAAKVFENKIAISEYVSQRIGNVDKDEEGNYNYTLFKQIISETNANNLAHQKRLVDDAVKVNFTTNVDDIKGNNSDNIFETVVSGFMGKNTFQAADKLDGQGGNDTLKVSLDTNFTGLTTGSVKNIENLEITNTSNAVRYFNMNNMEDVQNVVMIGDYASRLTNEAKIVTLSANDIKRGEIAIVYNPSTVAGSNDSQELVLENVGNKTDDLVSNPAYNYYKNHVGVKFDGIENLNITTRTQESYIKDVNNKNITVKGNVNLDINTGADVESLDASGFTGNLTAGLKTSTQLKSVKGGSGKDLFKFNGIAGANPDLVIDGGANDDSIEFEDLSGTRRLNSSNVENVTFVKDNSGTIDLANAQDVKSVTVVENNNTINVTNSAITTLNIDTDYVENTRVNVTTATLDTINFTDRDLSTYRVPNFATTKQIVANSATKLTMNIDKYSNVSDLGGGEQSLEATSLKILNMNIEKSADETKYSVDSFRLIDTASLETINYVNEGKDFELRVNNTLQALDKLATLNVKTASSFNIKDLNTNDEAHLRNISEISLQGIIKSDDTTDSDVILGNLGHNSSLHGINLTAKQLGVLKVGNVTTNTQINARFNVNLEDIRDDATIGNIKSGNTVIIAKTLAKDLTIGNMDADTIATESTDNVRMAIFDVEGGVDIGNIVNLSSLDGDYRNIKKAFALGNITNSKEKSAILLNFLNMKDDVAVGTTNIEASEIKIVAKNVEKTFKVADIDLMATPTNGKAHEANLSLDGIKDAVTIGDISNLNSLNGDFKNLGDKIDIGNISGTQIDSTATLKFTNVKDSVTVGTFGNGDQNEGTTYTVTADKLAKELNVGAITIKESPNFYDVHKSAVNINSGVTEGIVNIGNIDTGADSKVTVDLSKSLQANTIGNIKGGEIVYKSSAITASAAVTLEAASKDKINVDSKIDVTGSVGQDEFVFKSTADAKTFTVTGTLGDGEDKYTLDLVASNNLKTVNLSGLKGVEHGIIDLTTIMTVNKQSLSLVATDGKDEITVGAITVAGTTEKPNVVTIDGGRGVDTFKLDAAVTDANASKYVSLVNIEKGDKIELGTVSEWAKYTAADLNAEATLKDAVNKVLTDAAATVANKVWAFTYKNDTYLVKDADGGSSALTASDNLVKLAGQNIEDLNPFLDSGTFTI
ncbi:hypothetical protein [uncultured Campylobacter sp.]|mgnify:FL=1|uniref:DUF4214 domain-containing protein n=1 Tax=uncultured Campylobacter sp. TaxID=218934 RepID=UPI002616CFCB|nr:hypothetical protein [uncultured Campylobacter sp.]